MSDKNTERKRLNSLKDKVGSGGISPLRIERAEDLLQKSNVEFGAYVKEQIINLDQAISEVKDCASLSTIEQLALLTPVMTLKAHGAMFGYQTISNVAQDTLHLLEHVERVNDDLCEILDAFKSILHTVVDKDLKHDQDITALKPLTQELRLACERYLKKY
tara:strand:+ start:406100 stop:406582 length:483 start_codon:yes stop_codon:yes gene_type:complete